MKKIAACIVIGVLFGTGVFAQEQERKAGPTITEWLKGLQNKIASIMPKKTVNVSTGVAGVRGAKEDSQVKLYWKGKRVDTLVTEEEMAKFKDCLKIAETGDRDASIKKLEEFMKTYPDSTLIPDAKKTLDLVKAMPRPEQKPQEQVQKPAGQKPDASAAGQMAAARENKKEEQK